MADVIDDRGRAPPLTLEIEAALVANQLQLEVSSFRRLMEQGKIAVLCERGVGEDSGTYRASFYHGKRCARLVVDSKGRPVAAAARVE